MSSLDFTISPSVSADAGQIAALLRRSILELCVDDHCNDPEKFAPWLSNKTPENVERWITGPDRIFSAKDQSRHVIGVAMGTLSGEVVLNYVLPEARFSKVSKMLMHALEDFFYRHGVTVCTLKSTATAERFYRSIGYTETGAEEVRRGMKFRTFKKELGG